MHGCLVKVCNNIFLGNVQNLSSVKVKSGECTLHLRTREISQTRDTSFRRRSNNNNMYIFAYSLKSGSIGSRMTGSCMDVYLSKDKYISKLS